ncbi:hypothetical protein QOZ80_1BG0083950 [Eleusine coracana subsp. coracana]|uniref:Uncharacterized protein n=1 Tax=Eleusine coracana subsp. coracana TaxID=191504 RepID=A0AAV9G2S1_ELECO|nr:hypothetical protein QOZ80_UnG0729690 [Eleusine coracana subsp. coracana]KAK3161993.1 hypothetical protein QOZ80_1BG0083950 [Eleusine coracana subsp. coracana]
MDTIRCCIACILPCGALDVVRIVHSNGRVEEISGPVLAGEIMKAYPKHVLRKPPSTCPADGGGGIVVQKPVILPPNAELQKGKIYFLMPVMAPPPPSPSTAPEKVAAAAKQEPPPATAARRRRRRKDHHHHQSAAPRGAGTGGSNAAAASGLGGGAAATEGEKERLLANERYLSEIMKEKASTARDRRRGRVAVWRPHLESITEDDL